MQTAGQLSSYDPKTEKYFQQILKLILNFPEIWTYTDTNFCPTLAPFIGFMLRQLLDDNIVPADKKDELESVPLKLAKKCWKEFERGEKDFTENPK